MTALHHACQAVESGECALAVVAGVNLILTPTTSTSISAYGALSPDGLCKTFDSSADGYGRGEGVNAILIKRLDLALQKEDPVRAVIRATAINSDGNSPMVGVPRPESQEILIRRAYEKAGIDDLSKTGFFECHGTGTQKGDVVETSVIAKVFEKGILMGSVSSFNNCIISLFLIISFPQCTHIVASYRPNQIWGTRRVRQDSPA
jgi:acyl transferase domain-containing protein